MLLHVNYTPANKVWGYIGITLLVCPSVCAIVSGPYISYGKTSEVLYTKIAYDLRVCHNLDIRSFGQVQGHRKEKCIFSCPVYIFLIKRHWKFLLHTNFAFELRVFHEFDLRSFGQVQDHWKKCIIRVKSISFILRDIVSSFFTQRLLMT